VTLPLLASASLMAGCGGDDGDGRKIDPDDADRTAASLVRNVVSLAEACRATEEVPDRRCRTPKVLRAQVATEERIASALVAGKPDRGQVAVQRATRRRLRVLAVSDSGNRFAFTSESRSGGRTVPTFSCVTPGHAPSAICRGGSWGDRAARVAYARRLESTCGSIIALRSDLVRGVRQRVPSGVVDDATDLPGIRNLYAASYERTARLLRVLALTPAPPEYASFQQAMRRLQPVATRTLGRRAARARRVTSIAALDRLVATPVDPTNASPDVTFPRDLRTAAPSCRAIVPKTTG
jgi:hypothetical protein